MVNSGDEADIVRRIERRQRAHDAVVLGAGDDMAIVRSSADAFLLSSDMVLDGVHFDRRRHDLEIIGRKALACCVSDAAAMAVRPVAATVSVALCNDLTTEQAVRLLEGAFAAGEALGVPVVGGDTTRWAGPLAIDVAVVAEPYPGVRPVRRSGASMGDHLFVTGPVGGSALGRHLTFAPRVRESREIAEALGDELHAMIDISDGLSLDLWRMCVASGVGAVLDEIAVERAAHEDARTLAARDGRSVLDHAMSDGEDFELLLAASPSANTDGLSLLCVGEVAEDGLSMRHRDGRVAPFSPKGFLH